MDKWQCIACEYIYDPDEGTRYIPPGVPWEELPDDWVCPDCQAGKETFEKMES